MPFEGSAIINLKNSCKNVYWNANFVTPPPKMSEVLRTLNTTQPSSIKIPRIIFKIPKLYTNKEFGLEVVKITEISLVFASKGGKVAKLSSSKPNVECSQ